MYNRGKTDSSTNGVGKTRQVHAKKMKLDHRLIQYTKINSKWIQYLNVSCKTIEILEENIGSKISDTSHRNIFADISPRARETEEK